MMTLFPHLKNIQANFVGVSTKKALPSESIFFPKQVHGDKILILEKPDEFAALTDAEADAVISFVPSLPIGVKTADCVPILLAHPQGVVAAVHAGWRGSALKILQKTLQLMEKKLTLDLTQVHLAIGPAICGDCYEVGEEVASKFQKDPSYPKEIIKAHGENYLLDLVQINFLQAIHGGVSKEKIRVVKKCTYTSGELYSYRRAQKNKTESKQRNISWINFSNESL